MSWEQEKPTLLIDRCSKGDGLWFDKGELNNIIARAKLDEGNKIKKVLADMFGDKVTDLDSSLSGNDETNMVTIFFATREGRQSQRRWRPAR